jgi:PAS domain S-box-containing protein
MVPRRAGRAQGGPEFKSICYHEPGWGANIKRSLAPPAVTSLLPQDRVQLPYSLHTTSRPVQFIVGFCVVALAITTRAALEPVLDNRLELITLWVALVPLAWLLSGPVFWSCSLMGLVGAYWFVLRPHGTAPDDLGFVLLIIFSVLIITGLWFSVRVARRSFDQYVRMRTQEGLTESRLAAIVQNSDDAIISKDLSGKILSFNPAAERLFGYAAQDVIGKPIQIIIPEELLDEERGIISRILSGDRIEHLETRRRARDGSMVDVALTISPVRDHSGAIVGVSKIARDITHRKAMERERDLALQRFARVTQALPDMIFLLDAATGAPILTNPAVTLGLGFTLEQLTGMGDQVATVVHPDDAETVRANLATAATLKDGELLDFEHRALRADGTWAILRARLTPFERDAEGRCTVLLAVDRDITRDRLDQLQLAEYRQGLEQLVEQRTIELEQSHQQLRAAERLTALGTLSQGLGHDIGNLVLPLRLRIQSLRTTISSASAGADLDAVDAGLSYVQGLSRSLRMLAMDPADPRQSGAGVTDLEEWWGMAMPVLKTVLPRSGTLKWSFHKPGDGRILAAIAPHQLLQVVFNLVQNAAEALEGFSGDPSIEVAAELGRSQEGDPVVRVSVIDHGPGMSEEVRRRCMEPFFSTKDRRLSGGLGLSLVAAITSSVRGRVELVTAPGKGARFTLEIAPAEAPQLNSSSELPQPQATAAVSVSDSRTLAYVQWTMRLLGIDAKPLQPDEQPMARLWVVGPERAHDAAEFARQSDRWAVVLGNPATNGGAACIEPNNDRVLYAGPRPPVSELRKLLGRAYPIKRAEKELHQ